MTKYTSLITDASFRREIEDLYRLGPRVTGELIAELAHRYGDEVRTTLASFAELDVDALKAIDALLWPPMPLTIVRPPA